MSQTVSNHEKNRVESWVKLGQIMSRIGSIEPNRVESQNRNMSVLGRAKSRKYFRRTKSQHTLFGSRKVATYLVWAAKSRLKFLRLRKVAAYSFGVAMVATYPV